MTLKTSNYLLQEKQFEPIERYKMRVSFGEDQMDALRVLGYCLGGRILLGILGGGVPPSSSNPDPISDQKM